MDLSEPIESQNNGIKMRGYGRLESQMSRLYCNTCSCIATLLCSW